MRARSGAVLAAAATLAVWALARWIVYPVAQVGDTRVSQHVARMIDAGFVPYRDFDIEYPPLAAGIFWLIHAIPGPPLTVYSLAMGVALALAAAATWLVADHLGLSGWRRVGATAVMACLPLLVGTLLQTRYDLLIVAPLAWALLAGLRGRYAAMWTLVAVASALKLAPLLVVPLLVAWQWRADDPRRAVRQASVAVAGVALTVLPFLVIAPGGTLRLLDYHLARPLQVESLGAALIQVARLPAHRVFSYGSDNLTGGLASAVAGLSTLALIVAIALLTRRVATRGTGPAALTAAMAAGLLATLVLGKVLSAQYVVWALPAALLVPGRLGVVSAVATAGALPLTQVVYPVLYGDLVERSSPSAALALLGRNILLLVALVAAGAAIGAQHGGRVTAGKSGGSGGDLYFRRVPGAGRRALD